MKKVIICTALLLMIFVVGCRKIQVDEAFENTPTERIELKKNELKEALLKSEEGYRVRYFPDNKNFGGFTFFMKFNKDNTVDMTSNVDKEKDIQKSSYRVDLGTTVELVFETRNHIHKLTDGDRAVRGQGYRGNSSFQYQRTDDKGNIYFKEIRRDMELVFEPATSKKDWDFVKLDLEKSIEDLITPNLKSSVFQELLISKGEEYIKGYMITYDNNRNFFQGSNKGDKVKFGILLEEGKFIVSPPIKEGNAIFSEFKLDSGTFVSESGEFTAKLQFSEELPPYVTDYTSDLKNIIKEGKAIFILNTIRFGKNSIMSPGYVALDIITFFDMIAKGTSFNYMFISFKKNENNKCELGFVINGVSGRAFYEFDYEIKDKKLYITYIGPKPGPGDALAKEYEPIFKPTYIKFLTSKNGLYFEYFSDDRYLTSSGTFNATPGTFTSMDDTSLRAYLYIP